MPGIYELRCNACDFRRGGSASTWVTLDDGSERVCGHPLERSIAEELTGRGWAALMRAGRITYKHAFLCTACGAAGDYTGPRGATHVGSIVHQPTLAEAAALRCSACGATSLRSIAEPSSPLGCASALVAIGLVVFGGLALARAVQDGTRSTIAIGGLAVVLGLALAVNIARFARVREPPMTCPSCRSGALTRTLVAVS